MSQSPLYKFLNEIDNYEDIPGADTANDQLDVDVVQSILAAALASNGTDSLLVDSNTALDASAAEVDVDLNSQTLAALSTDIAAALGSNGTDSLLVQEDTPLDVSGAAVPLDESPQSNTLASSVSINKAAGNAVTAALPTDDNSLYYSLDSLGDATSVDLNVEYSPDGGTTWYPDPSNPIVSLSSTGSTVLEIGYQASHTRVSTSSDYSSTLPTSTVQTTSR